MLLAVALCSAAAVVRCSGHEHEHDHGTHTDHRKSMYTQENNEAAADDHDVREAALLLCPSTAAPPPRPCFRRMCEARHRRPAASLPMAGRANEGERERARGKGESDLS